MANATQTASKSEDSVDSEKPPWDGDCMSLEKPKV